MPRPSISSHAVRCRALCFALAALLSACTQQEPPAPTPVARASYVLQEVRYFLAPGDGVDTTRVELPAVQVQNAQAKLVTQLVETGFGELAKTSRFELASSPALPPAVDLHRFSLPVPAQWDGQSFTCSVDSFPLSPTEYQRPYGVAAAQQDTLRIPPTSRLVMHRQIEAYHLRCSFQAVVRNTATGQHYPVQGNWQGLLAYGQPAVTLTQYPL